ncbi:hypothetical protein CDD82_513 [Ophiocordyceps australis]|uniref:DUF1254 domain-containing protein n=1 Tax=Ophiocordyceps australis TaxID=1399860 RepID=A0A2C5ZQE8_9HYPO|nr:hypothetical protein CDD82_513 [Ophiocordyceps australis]
MLSLCTALQALLLPGMACFSFAKADATVDEATEFSLIYGYPLLAYSDSAVPLFEDGLGPQEFLKKRKLAGPEDKSVVRPNSDTLYSMSLLDLSCDDVVVEVPNVTDRYWVESFYDMYGNNYANLGPISKTPPGKYCVRYAVEANEEPGVQLCEDCSDFQGFINSPTIYGTVTDRFLVRDNGTDLAKVHDLQDHSFLIYPIVRNTPHRLQAPPLSQDVLDSCLSNDTPTKIMQLLARLAPYNPSRNISDLNRVNTMLNRAGICDGDYTLPPGVDLAKVAEQANKSVVAQAVKPENIVNVGNGWSSLAPSAQGDYYIDYKMRAYVAKIGYLALVPTEALYPSRRDSSGSTSLNIGPREAYIITFVDGSPPLAPLGFWSMTAYNGDQFLVPNDLNRYSLGDRSSLTYPDGSSVSEGGTQKRAFQILVQPADVAPPSNWTSKSVFVSFEMNSS